MKTKQKYHLGYSLLALMATFAWSATSSPVWAGEDDQAAIASTAETFVEAFDKGDAKGIAAFWTPEGD